MGVLVREESTMRGQTCRTKPCDTETETRVVCRCQPRIATPTTRSRERPGKLLSFSLHRSRALLTLISDLQLPKI